MKRYKKKIILFSVLLVIIVAIFLVLYNIFRDKNSLNVIERTWLNNNKSSVISVNIQNNLNVFSNNGVGVFYDFLSDIEDEHDLELNTNVVSGDIDSKFGFNKGFSLSKSDLLFYTDNYVLISKENILVNNVDSLKENTIGLLALDAAEVAKYYPFAGNTITNYETSDELFNSLKEGTVNYAVIPLNEYKDVILSSNYYVVNHLDDLKVYYYWTKGENETLNSIFNKFYNNWIKEDFSKSYYSHNYDLFISALNITEAEEATLTSKDYVVGVLDLYPYQIIRNGDIRGINNIYLEDFQKFSDVDFKYKKYKTKGALEKAIEKNKINLAFNPFVVKSEIYNIDTNIGIEYVMVSPLSNTNYYDSISSVKEEIYVLKDSKLYSYLSSIDTLKIKTYEKITDIKKLMNDDKVLVLDKLTYDNYANQFGDNYSIRLIDDLNINMYSYMFSSADTFSKIFSRYIMTLNSDNVNTLGLIDFEEAYISSTKVATLARYILLLLIILVLAIVYFVRKSKRIVLNTKIKKDEKLKFIDMLTSLKNRNYLNEKMEVWNQNTIYPQAVIMIDLNNIKYLNDTFGHEEGDRQIQGAANVLFKIQPDNTEIIRTDGNEFMIYMVGYSESQVVSFIKKLIKEFKKLPYEYSAAIGFSMIIDDLKLVEDAINEASEKMRQNKASMVENGEEN